MMSMLQTSFGLVSIVQTNIFMHNEMLKSKKQNAQFHCVLTCHSGYRCSSAPVQIQRLFEHPKPFAKHWNRFWNSARNAIDKINATARGFEPLRAEPNGFRVHLLNRSDTVSLMSGLKSVVLGA